MNKTPIVSIIIPCRNEEGYIGNCLHSIILQDYPKESMEVFIVDGMSEDRTREIIREYTSNFTFLNLLENPKKTTPCAFNLGIKNSKGDIIIIMGAHAIYDKEYVSKCVKYMNEYNADNVGGKMETLPRKNTLVARAIAHCLSSSFGVGNSAFRTGTKEPKWVDTVFGGCYRKEVFDKIGMYNEDLIRSQDMEFNLRMKKAGLKTLLIPDIVSRYYARSTLISFTKHNFTNGVWAILPFKYSSIIPVSLRHFVPLLFVLGLGVSGLLALFSKISFFFFIAIVLSYMILNMYFSIDIAVKNRDLSLLFVSPLIFLLLHISYGIGSAAGAVMLLFIKKEL